MRWAACAGLLVCIVWACTPEPRFPGDEVMGTFALEAQPDRTTCTLGELTDAGLILEVTLSRERATNQAYVTFGGLSRVGSFDGQVVTATYSAERRFEACGCAEGTVMEETLRLSLLSRTQNELLQGRCPERPLDGGVPAADPVAGIEGPGSTQAGFNAIRACGELEDRVVPGPGCACLPCAALYVVKGVRR